MAIAKGLRMQIGVTQTVAIALHEMVEVLENVEPIWVPCAPIHCQWLVRWRNQLVPLFDPMIWCGTVRAEGVETVARFHAIVSFETGDPNRLGFGCLALHAFPAAMAVDDQSACALPNARWAHIAHSCFRDGTAIMPILNLPAMFDRMAEGSLEPLRVQHASIGEALTV
ncbi:MAG: hypothetical protein ACKVQU_33930 [Burkholderiales bacterium]